MAFRAVVKDYLITDALQLFLSNCKRLQLLDTLNVGN